MYQPHLSVAPQKDWPTMYDLPSEDSEEMGLQDEFHDFQPELLRQTFRPPGYPAEQIFTGTDMNLYYDRQHPLWHKRPDWFGVLGVSRFYQEQDLRLSYVVWDEGVNPFVVVELLSPGTEDEDLGQTLREVNKPPTKWQVYEQILQIPYYFLFNRYNNQFRAFQLIEGSYQPMLITADQKVWLEESQLGLGVWQGAFQGMERLWLRWFDRSGNWIPTPEEYERQRADRAEQQAELASQEVQQERERSERLAAKLRELGIEIE
jgi:Uma2 family endonuclease